MVGGGNSAGQAAVFLSRFVAKIWMLVRGSSLAESMSRYLIDRIAALPNVEIMFRTEIVGLIGSRGSWLERVRWRRMPSGEETERPIRNVFLFIGAEPATQWLQGCGVALDDKGFVLAGAAGSPGLGREKRAFESSVAGVFAVGDIRAGSVKRVGAAIGEGAAAVAQLNAFLETVPNVKA